MEKEAISANQTRLHQFLHRNRKNISGYNNSETQNLKGTITLNYNVKRIEGLSAKAFVNYLQDYGSSKQFVRPVNFYTYDTKSDIYTLAGSLGAKATMSTYNNRNKILTGQLSLKYDHTFAKVHQITALALYEAIDYYSEWSNAGRINYLTPAIDQLFAGSTVGMSNNGAAEEMGRVSSQLSFSMWTKI